MGRLGFIFLLNLVFLNVIHSQSSPIDAGATQETKNLYANLQRIAGNKVMFGHQDDLAYGLGWQYEEGRSDVKEVVGEYPAVVGWELGHLELGKKQSLDSVPFDRIRIYAQQVYDRGGLNTFSWHLNNPLDPEKSSWDKHEYTIRNLFNDRKALKRYQSWLDELAVFMNSLTGPEGELIPVVFRPFHEHTGSWFWWGQDHSTPEEYKQLWRFTVDYLRRKNVHNLLYAYSTGDFYSKEEFLERYPGDEYVDMIGFDNYHRPNPEKPEDTFVADTRKMVEMLREIGEERKKVWALTEIGLERIPDPQWWTQVLLPIVKDAGLSYVLVWRNARPDHYYAPYPGQVSAEDFKSFYREPDIIFGKEVARENLYAPIAEIRVKAGKKKKR